MPIYIINMSPGIAYPVSFSPHCSIVTQVNHDEFWQAECTHICQKTFFNSGRWWPCTADSSLSATPLSPPQTCHKQIQPADNIIPAQSTLLTVLQFRVLHHHHHHHRRHLGVGQALISYEWVFKHYDSLYRNCIFQYILKEKHQKTLGCNTSIWFVATESKAFWSFVRTRWCLSQSHTCHNLKDKKSSFDTFSKILPLLRPEFFTARCKIGWDWINLERCYSPKLSVAARIIGYLWSIKIILIFSDATEEERA